MMRSDGEVFSLVNGRMYDVWFLASSYKAVSFTFNAEAQRAQRKRRENKNKD